MAWPRLALAALAACCVAAGAQAQTDWDISCTDGFLTVETATTSGVEVLKETCVTTSTSQTTTSSTSFNDAGVSMVINDVSGELTVYFTSVDSLKSLTITAGNGTEAPIVNTEGLSSAPLYSLSLNSVNFVTEDANLAFGTNLNYLSVVGSNAKNISLSSSNTLQTLTLGGSFDVIPHILYQYDYDQLNGDNAIFTFKPASDFKITTDESTLTTGDYSNLTANVPDLSSIGINCTSDAETSSYTCTSSSSSSSDASSINSNTNEPPESPFGAISGTNSSSSSSNSSAGSSSSETESSDGGSGLSTALIVVIVIVVIVALVLLFFIVRHCRSRRAASAANGADDNTVTLMAKAETPGGGSTSKGSFISSDEFLRTFRVEQSDVTLTKSLGTGRLWMGEYQNNKVIIKRVEAEVTESFVTKELMNQARTMASLSHPNIVSLVGVTWLAGTDFAVIAEFLAKGNLKTVLANLDVELDLMAKLQICLDVAQGLAYLHDRERNMCMKSLSSRKVLVNGSLACKLNLFECVSAGVKIDRNASAFPFGMGEVAWVAPEVLTRSAPMDARKANVFAFGVLVGEILTRAAPYQTLVDELGNTLSDVEILSRVKHRRQLSPHELRHEYVSAPPSLREAVEACLSYDTMGRPTAEQLVFAVQRAMEEARTTSA